MLPSVQCCGAEHHVIRCERSDCGRRSLGLAKMCNVWDQCSTHLELQVRLRQALLSTVQPCLSLKAAMLCLCQLLMQLLSILPRAASLRAASTFALLNSQTVQQVHSELPCGLLAYGRHVHRSDTCRH